MRTDSDRNLSAEADPNPARKTRERVLTILELEVCYMDYGSHYYRRAHWVKIIQACQNRPSDITAKQWLKDNRISDKSYYYWLLFNNTIRGAEASAAIYSVVETAK
jgi:hypothetical protein